VLQQRVSKLAEVTAGDVVIGSKMVEMARFIGRRWFVILKFRNTPCLWRVTVPSRLEEGGHCRLPIPLRFRPSGNWPMNLITIDASTSQPPAGWPFAFASKIDLRPQAMVQFFRASLVHTCLHLVEITNAAAVVATFHRGSRGHTTFFRMSQSHRRPAVFVGSR